MLAQENYIAHAHRLSDYEVADSVKDVHPGQLFQLDEEGKWEYADGTKKAYPTLNARYPGVGRGLQGELLDGRDNVSRAGKLACLKGNYEIGTDQYDKTATYTTGAPLVPGPGGLVTMAPAADANPLLVIGFVTRVPDSDEDFLRYEG